jgi:uncharacterized RDD family membrane protein YckC
LEWAWALALGFLAFYVFLALLFPSAMRRCVGTLEAQPGVSFLAALLTVLLTPVLLLLLMITVIGIALLPFLGIGFFFLLLFGKAVVLAALGHRLIARAPSPFNHVAIAVLIGGVIVLALYVVPVVGFIVQNLTGLLGLGVVVYTLVLGAREKRDNRINAASANGAASAPAFTASAATSASSEPVFDSAAAAESSALRVEPRFSDASGNAGEFSTSTAEPAMSSESSTQPGPIPATAIPSSTAASLPRATFVVRMGALLIDVVLIAVIVNSVFDHGDLFSRILVPLALYGAVMWKLKGSTIGGIVLGLQVVRLDGRPIDWATAFVRALGCFLSFVAVGLGFLWILFDSERQAWHDKIAGTVVVRLPKSISLV